MKGMLTKKNRLLLTIAFICIAAGIITATTYFFLLAETYQLVKTGQHVDMEATGTIGDFIGGIVGTMWSLAGVILFYVALRQQSTEIGLQIREMNNTRNMFVDQQFETTFFNLLKVQQEIRNGLIRSYENIPTHKNKVDLTELDMFEVLANKLRQAYSEVTEAVHNTHPNTAIIKRVQEVTGTNKIDRFEYLDSEEKIARIAFYTMFKDSHNQLSHYFRHLYHILTFIEQREEMEKIGEAWGRVKANIRKVKIWINNEPVHEKVIKKRYRKFIDLTQAQMSSSELLLLFYDGICFDKMKRLIMKYELIENLSVDELLNPNHVELYDSQKIDGKDLDRVKLKNKLNILHKNLE